MTLRVKTVVTKTYYVETPEGWIYGGPFETKEEAKACLDQTRTPSFAAAERKRAQQIIEEAK